MPPRRSFPSPDSQDSHKLHNPQNLQELHRMRDVLLKETELKQIVEQARHLVEQTPESTVYLPPPLSLNELVATAVPQPEWIVQELVPVGVTLLVGKPHVGKSVLALSLALAVAEGALFMRTFPTVQGTVLYLGLEESRKHFYDRVYTLLYNASMISSASTSRKRIAPESCEWAGHWNALSTCGLADLEDWLEAHPTACSVVIDSLERIRPTAKDIISIQEDSILYPLTQIAQQHHVAILLLHHLHNATSVATLDNLANAQYGGIDGFLHLRRKHEAATARLFISGRDTHEQELLITFDQQQGYILVTERIVEHRETAPERK